MAFTNASVEVSCKNSGLEPVYFHIGWQVEIFKNGVHFGFMKRYETYEKARRGAQNKCYREEYK
jgi:hypothetical protein